MEGRMGAISSGIFRRQQNDGGWGRYLVEYFAGNKTMECVAV